jgi:CRISPR-associated endonuclease/helicase Cas3
MVAVTDILLDLWALTSIRGELPGRPEVARFLHGITSDPPETFIVWRQEVGLFGSAKVDPEALSEWFDSCRIEPRERLRDVTGRVAEKLRQIAETRGRLPVVVLNSWGRAKLAVLADLVEGRPQDVAERLAYRTIVLPVEAGGLSLDGFFDAAVTDAATDVAECGGHRLRRVLTSGEDVAQIAREHSMIASLTVPLGETEEEEAETYLALFVKRAEADDTVASLEPVLLADHTAQVEAAARSIGERVGLDAPVCDALAVAAKWHDRGKDRQVWQEAIHHDGAPPMAKAGLRGMNPRMLAGYRHEFGSLLEAAADPQVANHAERDLILHLIAAHHGRARPHFEPGAYDRERPTSENSEAALEVMRRFPRLQKRFGRWGLAWLEALLRCADAWASEQAQEVRATHAEAVRT